MRNRRLRGEDDAVADAAVAGDTDLTGKDDVIADDRRAGETGLRADECVVADAGSVADLDQIVDLCAFTDFGSADGGAVDGGVCLDVDAAAEADRAGLRDFFPMALLVFGEAKAISADDCAVLSVMWSPRTQFSRTTE